MWDLIKRISRSPRRSRKLSLLAANIFVASFLCSLFVSSPAFAADATWTGNTISYNGNSFSRGAPIAEGDARNPVVGTHVYEYLNITTNTLEVLYIDKSVTDPTKATSAQHVVYKNFTPPDSFTEMSAPTAVTIAAATTSTAAKSTSTCDSSIFGSLGWIMCGVANFLAKAVDSVYDIVQDFLVVTTLTTDKDNSIFKVWQIVVSLANICFILVFLYVVYVHLVSANVQQYNMFKLFLPRLLVAAILVNVSYWICAFAVDTSNFLGYSIDKIFDGVRESVGLTADIDWNAMTTFVLSAGTIGGFLGFAAATGGSFTAAGFLLISMLVSVALAALAAFVILAARQALIVIFIIIAPLAFVAWTLPNTEKYFKKWLSAFSTLLLLFPIFAVLFGGSLLAGAAIINSANGSIVMVIIGMAVQVIPLALTPMIVRFSTGVLGQVANMTNSKTGGLADRSRNWANDNAKHHKLRKAARTDQFVNKKNPLTWMSAQRVGRTMDRNSRNRKMMDDENEELLSNRAGAEYRQRVRQSGRGKYANQRDRNMRSHSYHERANLYKDSLDADGEKHWSSELDGNDELKRMKQQSTVTRGSAKVITDAIDAADERALQQTISASPTLSKRKAEQIRDSGIAKINEAKVEAGGNLMLQNYVLGSTALQDMITKTVVDDNTAKVTEAIVKQQAEAHWNSVSKTDVRLQELRLQGVQTDDKAKLVEQEWNSFVENIRAVGSTAPDVAASSQTLADQIRRIHEDTQVQSVVQESAKTVQQQDFAELLKTDATILQAAAGVGGDSAKARVLARAKSTVSNALVEDIKNIQNTMPYERASDAPLLQTEFQRQNVPMAERIAMVWAASKNGNFGYETALEMIDWYQQNGGGSPGVPPSTADMIDFKELIGINDAIKGGGRDVELYLNAGNDTTKRISDFTNDFGTWNIHASRFVDMGETRQLETIAVLNRTPEGQARLEAWRHDIESTPTLRSRLKTKPKQALGIPL